MVSTEVISFVVMAAGPWRDIAGQKHDYLKLKDKLKCKRLYYTGQIDTYFAYLGGPSWNIDR